MMDALRVSFNKSFSQLFETPLFYFTPSWSLSVCLSVCMCVRVCKCVCACVCVCAVCIIFWERRRYLMLSWAPGWELLLNRMFNKSLSTPAQPHLVHPHTCLINRQGKGSPPLPPPPSQRERGGGRGGGEGGRERESRRGLGEEEEKDRQV